MYFCRRSKQYLANVVQWRAVPQHLEGKKWPKNQWSMCLDLHRQIKIKGGAIFCPIMALILFQILLLLSTLHYINILMQVYLSNKCYVYTGKGSVAVCNKTGTRVNDTFTELYKHFSFSNVDVVGQGRMSSLPQTPSFRNCCLQTNYVFARVSQDTITFRSRLMLAEPFQTVYIFIFWFVLL